MAKKSVLLAAFALALLLALAVCLSARLPAALAQGPAPPEGHHPEAALGTGFTYQGRLRDSGGEPINSTCDFAFGLWNSLSGSTQIGADSTVTGVAVEDGYFTALVNGGGEFGAGPFAGEARWLEITVQCIGDASPITLTPRQPLNAAPYAHYSLGAPWSGLTGVPDLQLRITGTCAEGSAIRIVNANGSVMCQAIPADHWGQSWTGTGTGLTLSGGDVGLAGNGTTCGLQGESDVTTGYGVYGSTSAATGSTHGVHGVTASTSGSGVYGEATATLGYAYGVNGYSDSTDGRGVGGWATATTGEAYGVAGRSASDAGCGVYGEATRLSGTTYGVYGRANSLDGTGVYGRVLSSSGYTHGVYGEVNSTAGYGVYGYTTASTGSTYGVYGRSDSTDGYGVFGWASKTSGTNYGVVGQSASSTGHGVYGLASAGTGSNIGVYGQSNSSAGTGVRGEASAPSGTTYGVYGATQSYNGYSVYGLAYDGYGVYGYATATAGITYGVYGRTASPLGYGGYFQGDVYVNGDLSVSGNKAFKIDHPLDPANKYLYHYAIESPEVLNQYSGNVTLDGNGQAWVELPAWFGAINTDLRYQLTCVGDYAPVYIAQKVQDNRFLIAGGVPGLEISWQVTARRDDPYIRHFGAPVEQDKPAEERGLYKFPELYGQPEELGLEYQRRPAQDRASP